ncbi:hypothetical protein CCH79_00018532 [Gambusia affinis]|uniref:Uncharacterized protein n=1 Tax=Gambusia affinis TaxID=33528 RepID=A0A315UQF1_GAMAF|nr:hypothetical protein CCH79_00018532 [Gambusia affinis]
MRSVQPLPERPGEGDKDEEEEEGQRALKPHQVFFIFLLILVLHHFVLLFSRNAELEAFSSKRPPLQSVNQSHTNSPGSVVAIYDGGRCSVTVDTADSHRSETEREAENNLRSIFFKFETTNPDCHYRASLSLTVPTNAGMVDTNDPQATTTGRLRLTAAAMAELQKLQKMKMMMSLQNGNESDNDDLHSNTGNPVDQNQQLTWRPKPVLTGSFTLDFWQTLYSSSR